MTTTEYQHELDVGSTSARNFSAGNGYALDSYSFGYGGDCLVKNVRAMGPLTREKNMVVTILVGVCPSQVYTVLNSAQAINAAFFKNYGMYIWAKRTFVMGGYTAVTDHRSRADWELQVPTGERRLGDNDTLFVLVYMTDMDNSTATAQSGIVIEKDVKYLS